jgi:hypothetical protein
MQMSLSQWRIWDLESGTRGGHESMWKVDSLSLTLEGTFEYASIFLLTVKRWILVQGTCHS